MLNKNHSSIDRTLLVSAFLLAVIYSLRRMADTDLWAHLKCGEYLFQHGSILRTHYFNCSWPDFEYVNHSWLFQAAIYLVGRISGEPGLIALQVLLVIVAFFLLFRTLRLYTGSLSIISLLLSLGILASAHRFSLRPQHFTYVFFAFFLFSLHQYQRKNTVYAWFLPPLMMVWVNMHAESLWGLLVPGVFLVAEYLKSGDRGQVDRLALKKLLFIYGLILVAALINPFTYRTVFWPLLVMKEQFAGVEEILPPTSMQYLFFWVYFGLFLLSSLLNFRNVDPTWVLISFIFAVVAWTANRGIPHFVFASAPLFADNLQTLKERAVSRIGDHHLLKGGVKVVLLTALLVLMVSIVTSPLYFQKFDNVPYPERALDFLKAEGIEGNVFNEHAWGGYIIWHAYPALKPYIDGRFFHQRFYDEFYPTLAGQPGWDRVFAKYNITIAILRYSPTDSPRLNDRLFADARWRLVYWDDVSLVYVLTSELASKEHHLSGDLLIDPNRQLLADELIFPAEMLGKASDRAESNIRSAGKSYKAAIVSANLFFSLREYQRALERYQDAEKYIDKPNAWIYYKQALCSRQLGDLVLTKQYLEKCLALAPDAPVVSSMLREVRYLLDRHAGNAADRP
jgi:tetratricopeptide (TPR) repeat protein